LSTSCCSIVREIHQAVSRGKLGTIPADSLFILIYQDVSETARALRALIAEAVSAGCVRTPNVHQNAAAIHPDIFWVFFDAARELAQIVDGSVDW
jgi:hypothetical protein